MKELFKALGMTIVAFISSFYYIFAIFSFCEMISRYGYSFSNMKEIGLFIYVIFNIVKHRDFKAEKDIKEVLINSLFGTPFIFSLFYIGVKISLELLAK